MSSDADKIRAVVVAVLGADSPFLERVISWLQDERIAAREAAANSSDKKWLSGLSTAEVVAALADVAKPRRARRTGEASAAPVVAEQPAQQDVQQEGR